MKWCISWCDGSVALLCMMMDVWYRACRRVVPLEGIEDLVGSDDRDCVLVDKKIQEKEPPAPSSKTMKGNKESKRPQRSTTKRKRKEKEQYSPEQTPVRTTKVRYCCFVCTAEV